MKQTELQRFDQMSIPEPNTGCFLWLGSTNKFGYGRVCVPVNRMVMAHRIAYERRYGPIPSGLLVLHRCDVPSCVNTDHLFLGTYKDNAVDMKNKGRGRFVGADRNRALTHCPSEHEYAGDNLVLYTHKDGHVGRRCRECNRVRAAENRIKFKERNGNG